MNAERGIRKPNLNDYLAGALLANGIVWIWYMAVSYLITVMPTESLDILGLLTFLVFIGGSIATSLLVCRRADSGHLSVGLKLTALELIFSIIFMLSVVEPSIGLLIILVICFFIGSFTGSYLALRSSLKRHIKQAEPPTDD